MLFLSLVNLVFSLLVFSLEFVFGTPYSKSVILILFRKILAFPTQKDVASLSGNLCIGQNPGWIHTCQYA